MKIPRGTDRFDPNFKFVSLKTLPYEGEGLEEQHLVESVPVNVFNPKTGRSADLIAVPAQSGDRTHLLKDGEVVAAVGTVTGGEGLLLPRYRPIGELVPEDERVRLAIKIAEPLFGGNVSMTPTKDGLLITSLPDDLKVGVVPPEERLGAMQRQFPGH